MGRTADFTLAAAVATLFIESHFFATRIKTDRLRSTSGFTKGAMSPLLSDTQVAKVRSQFGI